MKPEPPDVEALIRRAIRRLRVDDDQVIELRALEVPMKHGRPAIVSGYFDNANKLVESALELEALKPLGIYVTLNAIDPALLGRANNRLLFHPKATTTDSNVIRRIWLPFDIDPVRPSGVSASRAELTAAKRRAVEVAEFLRAQLRSDPDIYAFSGNGYHLLYRIDWPNNESSASLAKSILDLVADRFSGDAINVDRAVHNAARIWKLYGTLARKGDEVPEQGRVHRRSRLLRGLDA